MHALAVQFTMASLSAVAVYGIRLSGPNPPNPPPGRGFYDVTTGTYRKAIEHVDVVGAARCSYPGCNREDYLPTVCRPCGKKFCKEHYPIHVAETPACQLQSRLVISCPYCEKNIVPQGVFDDGSVDDRRANEFLQSHMAKCQGKKKKAARCPVEGCNKKIPLVPIPCKCGVNYCMDHRLPESHNCPTIRSAAARTDTNPASRNRGQQSQPRQRRQHPAGFLRFLDRFK